VISSMTGTMKTPMLFSVLFVAAAVTTFAAEKSTKDMEGMWVPETGN